MISGAHISKKLSSLSTKKVSNSIVYDLKYLGTTVLWFSFLQLNLEGLFAH